MKIRLVEKPDRSNLGQTDVPKVLLYVVYVSISCLLHYIVHVGAILFLGYGGRKKW